MTCIQYVIKDAEEHNVTQEKFENFLENNFPEHKHHGVIKFLDNTLSRAYDIIENHTGLGKIVIQYKSGETLALINSRDATGLAEKLISKNSFYWTPRAEHYKHEYDKY